MQMCVRCLCKPRFFHLLSRRICRNRKAVVLIQTNLMRLYCVWHVERSTLPCTEMHMHMPNERAILLLLGLQYVNFVLRYTGFLTNAHWSRGCKTCRWKDKGGCTLAAHCIVNALWHISRFRHEATTASLLQFTIHSIAECCPRLKSIAVNGMPVVFLNTPTIEMPV